MIGDRVEFIRPEYFDKNKIDELFAKDWYFWFDFWDFFFWIGAGEELFPDIFIFLDEFYEITKGGVLSEFFKLFQLIFI